MYIPHGKHCHVDEAAFCPESPSSHNAVRCESQQVELLGGPSSMKPSPSRSWTASWSPSGSRITVPPRSSYSIPATAKPFRCDSIRSIRRDDPANRKVVVRNVGATTLTCSRKCNPSFDSTNETDCDTRCSAACTLVATHKVTQATGAHILALIRVFSE